MLKLLNKKKEITNLLLEKRGNTSLSVRGL
jgi:hypothetical protein